MKLNLFSDQGNFEVVKVVLAARLNGEEVQILDAKSEDPERFLKSKLLALEISEGKFLFQANTACKYFFLRANKVSDEDAENQILDWELSVLLPSVVGYLSSATDHDKKGHKITDELARALKEVDGKLSKSKYFLGDQLGVSDVCVFSTILPLLELKNQDVTEGLANLKRWIANIKANQTVHAVLEEFSQNTGVFKASPAPSSAQASAKPDKSGKAIIGDSGDQIFTEKVPQAEINAALAAWKTDPKNFPQPKIRKHPILPEEGSRNIMITSALPYVNNVPHLGNIIGCVLSADCFSRFCRLRNYNVLYICGTDEYGTATETKAMEEGVTPRQICDKYNKLHEQIYKWFNIDFDFFGRTTTEQQTEISQDIFWKLYNGGYILKDNVQQLFCTKCQMFLADRFVEGSCPLCGFDDARGDQCDGCGKLINAVELKNPKCKTCSNSPIIRSSNHLFLDLPKLEPMLKTYLDGVLETGTWTHNSKVITNTWIRDGLKPRCISRDLKWGTPIPLDGYRDKVFYVWFDAPIGYCSIVANYTKDWEKWWKNPGKIDFYNFLGKDNVPFHSVVFPACLLGANDNYTIVNNMIATEYLNYEDTKFSKSRNTGVFGDQAADTGIKADMYRFYLCFVRPESQDTVFSWEDFQYKNNTELLNNLGNFINRALMFLNNNFDGVIQEIVFTADDLQLLALITRELKGYIANLESCKLRDGIRNILTISRLGNQYMQANTPWVLAKGSEQEKKRAGSIVSLCANVSCLLSVLLQPYMPETSAAIQEQLRAPASVNVITDAFIANLRQGHQIGKPCPLFVKVENSQIAELKAKFAGDAEENVASKGKKVGARDVGALTQAVANLELKVHDLKASKADKTVIDAEEASLHKLKQELAQAQGQDQAAKGGKKGKKK